LNILVFLVTHSHMWHPKLCWDLLKVLSKEHTVQSPASAGCCVTQAAKSCTSSCACCCSLQRDHHEWRQSGTEDVLTSWTTLQKNHIFSHRVQKEQVLSWVAGMGENGHGKSPREMQVKEDIEGGNLDWTSLC